MKKQRIDNLVKTLSAVIDEVDSEVWNRGSDPSEEIDTAYDVINAAKVLRSALARYHRYAA